MVYLKTIQKITPMDVSVSGTIDQKKYLKKFKGWLQPPYPPPGSAYDLGVVCPFYGSWELLIKYSLFLLYFMFRIRNHFLSQPK